VPLVPAKPSISVAIPAFNEEGAVADVVARTVKTLQACAGDWEVIILDDCSKDRTWEILQKLHAEDPEHIRILRHERNQGIAVTLEEMYAAATKDYVFGIAGDGEYPPEALTEIVPLLETCDIVVCNRIEKPYTPYRQVISRLFHWLPLLLFGVEMYDPGSAKCIKRSIITGIPCRSKGVFVEAERLIRAAKRGHRIGAMDIRQQKRRFGKARGARFPVVYQAVKDLLSCWWHLSVMREKP
jgi:glycosyltransferase involved in cell wall biosynthesis